MAVPTLETILSFPPISHRICLEVLDNSRRGDEGVTHAKERALVGVIDTIRRVQSKVVRYVCVPQLIAFFIGDGIEPAMHAFATDAVRNSWLLSKVNGGSSFVHFKMRPRTCSCCLRHHSDPDVHCVMRRSTLFVCEACWNIPVVKPLIHGRRDPSDVIERKKALISAKQSLHRLHDVVSIETAAQRQKWIGDLSLDKRTLTLFKNAKGKRHPRKAYIPKFVPAAAEFIAIADARNSLSRKFACDTKMFHGFLDTVVRAHFEKRFKRNDLDCLTRRPRTALEHVVWKEVYTNLERCMRIGGIEKSDTNGIHNLFRSYSLESAIRFFLQRLNYQTFSPVR